MSSITRVAITLCALAVLGACAKKEEVVYTQPAVSVEPVYTGKL